jgi:hypothetical protein
MFFTFSEDARWNPDRMAVEFGVEIGEYRGVVRVSRRAFQRLPTFRNPPSGASKATIFTGRGWNSSPSGRSVAGS